MAELTILDDGRATTVAGTWTGDGWQVTPADLARATGWRLEPQGLCRGDVCVPMRGHSDGDSVSLEAVAGALGRPLVGDEGVVYLGASAAERADALAGLTAPDFALPDLSGTVHTLSEHRGSKVLIAAWASW